MKFLPRLAILILPMITSAFAANPSEARNSFDSDVATTLEKSMPRFACNLSPTKWKKWVPRTVDGKTEWVEIEAAKGSIIAAPHLDNPDYFFHWNRDSALVTGALVRYLNFIDGSPQAERIHSFMLDFIRFSDQLQKTEGPHGLGEVRFNVDGSLDFATWSRPQHDGPALRALTLMHYLKSFGDRLPRDEKSRLISVIKRDLDFVATNYTERNFDLWEYSIGHHFYTRVVQLGALEEALRSVPERSIPQWRVAIRNLKTALGEHWSEQKEYYTFSVGPVFDQPGNPVNQPGDGLDSSVIFASNHSKRETETLSFRDDRLLLSAFKLEKYFRQKFPFNHNPNGQLGPAMGRHDGDNYYGGNAFYFLTAGYAEHYFRVARWFKANPQEGLIITRYNRELFEELLGEKLTEGKDALSSREMRVKLISKMKEKGEAFLRTIIRSLPADGMMAEQFNKVDGTPASATDLTWSYSSFLSAVLAREELERSSLDLLGFDFSCR